MKVITPLTFVFSFGLVFGTEYQAFDVCEQLKADDYCKWYNGYGMGWWQKFHSCRAVECRMYMKKIPDLFMNSDICINEQNGWKPKKEHLCVDSGTRTVCPKMGPNADKECYYLHEDPMNPLQDGIMRSRQKKQPIVTLKDPNCHSSIEGSTCTEANKKYCHQEHPTFLDG